MDGHRLGCLAVSILLLLGIGVPPGRAASAEIQSDETAATTAESTIGYRGTSLHGEPGRALEYDSLQSSPLFNVKIFTDQGTFRLNLSGEYLNDRDYSAAARFDTREVFHLDLRSERFYHNLDHIPYDNGPSPAEGSRPDASVPVPPADAPLRVYYSDQNPGDGYGLRLDLSEAKLKIKCPDYPAHVTLSFWRYEKRGERQLRFADENCTTACHMQSRSREIDRVTEEVKLGADAHAGFIDLAVEALYRTFRDRQSIPNDYFAEHSYPDPVDRLSSDVAGLYEHDEDPDSQLRELTFRVNTAPSGGFVASASLTLGERENRSDLDSIAPIEAETDYTKTSADVTYTPGENWTFNLRYRLLDLDSDNTAVITTNSSSTNPNDLAVRESPDLTRAWYEALANYRPSRRLTIKAELRREDIERSNTGAAQLFLGNGEYVDAPSPLPVQINPTWQLPDRETITRAKLGFHSRLLEKSALKLSGWVAVQRNDDPAYGTSFADSREIFVSATYTHGPLWGVTANVDVRDEENDGYTVHQLSTDLQGNLYNDRFDLDRERRQQNASIGAWLTPREGLSFDINYGYLRTAIDQDLLFGYGRNLEDPSISYTIEDDDVEYRQTVQTVSAGVSWQATEQLACRLEGYHIRSKATYSPDFPSESFPYYFSQTRAEASSTDLREVSKLDLRQNGVRGRVDWKLDEHWSSRLEVTYNDYDELGNDVFDGSVQTCMVGLSRSW